MTDFTYFFTSNPDATAFGSFVGIVVGVLLIVSMWLIFSKAGEAGWKSIIPFYNLYIFFKITWGSGWFFLLSFIPIVNFIVYIVTQYKLAKAFGRGVGTTLGLIFFPYIFQLILGFGKAQYRGISR